MMLTGFDLYPNPNSDFCFTDASNSDGVSVLSLCRYDPAWDGEPLVDGPERDRIMLMRTCHLLCRELCHQFGLRNCIYYECLMNGNASA